VQTVVNPSCLDLGVFQIRPAVFEVLAGQSANLELVFAPLETEKYSEELVIVCDNCQVKYFTINGESQEKTCLLCFLLRASRENFSYNR